MCPLPMWQLTLMLSSTLTLNALNATSMGIVPTVAQLELQMHSQGQVHQSEVEATTTPTKTTTPPTMMMMHQLQLGLSQ